MIEQVKKLVNVKSLVTLTLTAVYAYLAVVGNITANDYTTMFYIIISFYFGTQTNKAV